MASVIAMANQKGGVGKTTTTMNLGIGLAKRGYRVLLIDADSQANLTMANGIENPDELNCTVSSVMQHVMDCMDKGEEYRCAMDQGALICHKEKMCSAGEESECTVDLLPANIELAGMEVLLNNRINRERILHEYVKGQKANYDYILIDCMPSLGLATINALSAADKVIIPTQAHYLSAKGIEQLLRNVSKVKRYINPRLEVAGILMTMVQKHTRISRELTGIIETVYGSHIKVFENQISQSIKAVEASAAGVSIFQYAGKSNIAAQYEGFTEEVVELSDRTKCKVGKKDELGL